MLWAAGIVTEQRQVKRYYRMGVATRRVKYLRLDSSPAFKAFQAVCAREVPWLLEYSSGAGT